MNLIALGSSILRPSKFRHFFCHCHKQAQELKIEPARVLEIVAAREACTPEEITELMDWTSRLIKPTDTQLRDALTDLSPGAMAIALRELKEAGRLSDYNQHQNERTK